ncbi:MAG: 3-oxoadipate enol-lactonase [Gaiellales bacterium]
MIPHYRLDGPPGAEVLVLGNSLGTTLDLWQSQLARFTQRYRVLRWDLRGHGGSPTAAGGYTVPMLAGDLVELLDQLGIRRFSMCGLSLGGAIGMWLAVQAPDRVERLVVACTTSRFGDPAQWQQRAALVRRDGTAAVADAAPGRWFTDRLREQQPWLVARFRDALLAVSASGYAGCCEAVGAWDFGSIAGSIAAPTLVIAGADDPVVTPADARDTASRIPGSRLLVLPDASHLANIDQPQAFGEAAMAHLMSHAGRRETA